MRRWLLVFAVLIMGGVYPVAAQPATATVRGFVTGQQDGEPL
jgi:hypothetical protein